MRMVRLGVPGFHPGSWISDMYGRDMVSSHRNCIGRCSGLSYRQDSHFMCFFGVEVDICVCRGLYLIHDQKSRPHIDLHMCIPSKRACPPLNYACRCAMCLLLMCQHQRPTRLTAKRNKLYGDVNLPPGLQLTRLGKCGVVVRYRMCCTDILKDPLGLFLFRVQPLRT